MTADPEIIVLFKKKKKQDQISAISYLESLEPHGRLAGQRVKVCTCAVSRSTEGKYKSSWLRSAQTLSLSPTSFCCCCLPGGLSSSF